MILILLLIQSHLQRLSGSINVCVFNAYLSNSRGVAVLFNNNFELKLHRDKKDNEGNTLAVDLSINENRVT